MWNGKLLREIYPHATRWQIFKFKCKRFFRKVFIVLGLILGVIIIFKLGGWLNPASITTSVPVIQQVEAKAPILDRIAACESGNHQYSPTNGQVLMKVNNNGTIDVGVMQINSVWFAQASALGYDLTTEQGNRNMAKWIYENKGTGDWSSSAKCWQK